MGPARRAWSWRYSILPGRRPRGASAGERCQRRGSRAGQSCPIGEGLPEEALRAYQQDGDQGQEDERVLELCADEATNEAFEDPQKEASDHRSPKVANAADKSGGKGLDP